MDKQLYYSDRTFDIIPQTVTTRNLSLERGLFNQASRDQNPANYKKIQDEQNKKYSTTNTYYNPYAISTTDFCDGSQDSRKEFKRNRTNIFDERINNKSQFINKIPTTNKYIDRFSQIDQNNINSNKFKSKENIEKQQFQDFLNYQHKMQQNKNKPQY